MSFIRCITLIVINSILFSACERSAPDTSAALKPYKDTVFTEHFRRTTGWVAGDGALSINLNNGTSLWVFGDSHIGHYEASTQTVPCLFQVRNAALSMGIQNPAVQTSYVGNGSPASLFQVGNDNTYWFWPGAGFTSGDTAYIFQGRIHHTGDEGAWAFEEVDSLYVAKINIRNLQVAGYSFLGTRDRIVFNNGVVTVDNYTYVYGIRNNGFGNDLFVARFLKDNIYATWEYYNGTSWSTDIATAAKIHSEFTASFHISKVGAKYVLITTEFSVGCNQGKDIYAYTADTPYGPFENKKIIWTVDDTYEGNYPIFYLASSHPEYDNGRSELLITYCINGYDNCINVCSNNRKNPDHYRPKAIRVPYKFIHTSM